MAVRPRNILSLCAGVGGLELGIALALNHRGEAARGICYVEREAAAAASLVASMEAGWFHPAPVWSDLLTFDARPWRGLVHILVSGDPCQDNSVAGQRAGAGGKRFLAPEVVRVAAECRPDLVFRENVPGNAGEQLDALVPPLERLGYRVAAGIFSSAETGNTMRRERLFVLAERLCDGQLGSEEPHVWTIEPGQQAPRRGNAERCGLPVGGTASARPFPTALAGADRRNEGGRPWDAEPQRRGSAMGSAIGGGDWRHAHDARWGSIGRTTADGPGGGHQRALPPAVIPGPTDRRWFHVLDRWPELQPALSEEEAQSHLRGIM